MQGVLKKMNEFVKHYISILRTQFINKEYSY